MYARCVILCSKLAARITEPGNRYRATKFIAEVSRWLIHDGLVHLDLLCSYTMKEFEISKNDTTGLSWNHTPPPLCPRCISSIDSSAPTTSPKAVSSFLAKGEDTTSESVSSIAVVALSLGLSVSTLFIVFAFVFVKRRRNKPPKDDASFASNPKSQAAFNKPEQVQRRINTEISEDTHVLGRLSKNQVPTPRLLPDLNFMLSDSSDDSTATEKQENREEHRVTFVMLPESKRDLHMRSIRSPIDGSVSVVHLLGLGFRSDDEISICSSPARMGEDDGDEHRFWV